jgi:hypothetical protein
LCGPASWFIDMQPDNKDRSLKWIPHSRSLFLHPPKKENGRNDLLLFLDDRIRSHHACCRVATNIHIRQALEVSNETIQLLCANSCSARSSCANLAIAQNPLVKDQFTADPTARVFEGKVYIYPSHDIRQPRAGGEPTGSSWRTIMCFLPRT